MFLILYLKKEFLQGHNRETYDKIMLVMDSIGLGIFTVVGVNTGISHGYVDYMFLLVFLGTITGVGGWITARYYGRSTSVYSGETYLCLCFNRGSNRLCGAVSEFWCSGVNGRSVSSSYIGQIPCGTLQMESSKAYPRRIVKKKYNHKYRKTALQLKSCFLVLKRGINIFFTEKSFQEGCVS